MFLQTSKTELFFPMRAHVGAISAIPASDITFLGIHMFGLYTEAITLISIRTANNKRWSHSN